MHQHPDAVARLPLAAGLFGMGSAWRPEPLLTLRRVAGYDV